MAKLTKEDHELKKAIATRIVELRSKSGLSQVDFAKQHDIDRQLLNRWESINNARGISIYTIQRFCKMIDLPLSDFFNADVFK